MVDIKDKAQKEAYFVRIRGELYNKIVEKAKEEERTITVVINRLLEKALEEASK